MEVEQDRRLAEAMLSGEPEAFHRFLDVYQRKVFQFSLLVCRHRDDAADIAQETLMSVFLRFGELREPSKLRPWVFRIAKNFCFLRRRDKIACKMHELPVEDLREQLIDRRPKPEAAAIASEQNRLLHGVIGTLPKSYRAVLLLRDWEGLSTADAAEVLEVSEELIRTRLRRARLAVRRGMERLTSGI